jgi:DNA mismatch repair protein, MutS family
MKKGGKLDLKDIKGIGNRMADKIISSFGGEEEFTRAVENFEVDRITSIDGISQHKAVEIVNSVLGNPTEDFLKTERAVQIYEDLTRKILDFASTSYAKNRILLMSPTKNKEIIMKNLGFSNEGQGYCKPSSTR